MPGIEELNIFACPKCQNVLNISDGTFFCNVCKATYEFVNGIPILLPNSGIDNNYNMNYIEHYKNDAETFDYFEKRECAATGHDERRLREYINSKVQNNSQKILDVGSGGAWAADEFSPKSTVISFDISERNIRKALDTIQNKNHIGVVGDALTPPFVENAFDCIIASEVIEHIVSPVLFIKGLMRILKPGGDLIISTPYKEQLHYSLCIHCNKMTPKNAHLHSFDEKILTSLYIDNDLENCKYYIFGNKALTILRTHALLKYLPFKLWKIIDNAANMLLNKPAHIIIIYKKKRG